ncbi:uncharacterized protein LOC142979583 [Anticarsia gemmatalis]|uniref:uncharacterized protein LOC142979583 n=1 Tax=Anticarsia gemmatalis TaxID=129554 RepID=UPI003F75F2E7
MAIYTPRLWWVAIALLLWAPHTHCREFTHEDIREAMLSIVHMIRMSEDKLERHEQREKGLGEHLKKMLKDLDKKHRALEPLKGMISRLDDRLSNVETILLQREEREKASQTKINDALGSIQKTLVALVPAQKAPAELDNSLTVNDDIQRRLDATSAKIDAVTKEIRNLKNSLSPESLRAIYLDVAADMNPFEKHMTNAEKLLNKYELKLNEFNGTANNVPTDVVSINEVAAADEAWHNRMSEVIERQEKEIKKIQNLLSDAESMWKDLPRLADLYRSTNQTLEAVSNSTDVITVNNGKHIDKVVTKLREMSDRLVATNEDIQGSLTESNTMTERAYSDISRSYEMLRNEVTQLARSSELVQATSDNVIATKKRLESVVLQIIMQLTEVIKGQHKDADKTVNNRLLKLQTAITNNQTLALNNLNSTLEDEMSQVWRQISIMHQQIMMTQQSLNKFSENTEQYVNSSTTTMNKMKTDVASISQRMFELGANMNHVVGEMSVSAQDFRFMVTGMERTIKNLNKNSTPAPVVKDAGPGPHQIPDEESATFK